MALPRAEKAHEKYAWILLFVPGLLTFIVSVFNIIVPAPIDATAVKNLTILLEKTKEQPRIGN